MDSYLNLLHRVFETGDDRTDRTGVGTRAVFGCQWRHDLSQGFPLLTTKKVHFKSVVYELLWFLSGNTNVSYLHEHGVTIWDEWADEYGDLGPIYGKQWRDFGGVDQINWLVNEIKSKPDSRRLIVSAWNPPEVPKVKLPPCHTLWQCRVANGRLDLHLYARSIDSFLGLPFNIASYGLLITILALECNLLPGELIISFGDLHIYKNHFDQVQEQIARTPGKLPTLVVTKQSLFDYMYEDFQLVGYNPQPAIKAPIAI